MRLSGSVERGYAGGLCCGAYRGATLAMPPATQAQRRAWLRSHRCVSARVRGVRISAESTALPDAVPATRRHALRGRVQGDWDELEPARFYRLYHDDRFKFAKSTRDYLIQDTSQCKLPQ